MLCCSGDRKVSPGGTDPEWWNSVNTEWDPPITFVDNFLFMPIMICPHLKAHLEDIKNYARPFFVEGKQAKVDPRAFIANVQLSPGNFYLPFEMVHFDTKDGLKLHGILVTQPKHHEKIPTIIFLHGNSGNIGDNLPWACTIFDGINCNIFMFDYRGYGFSPGQPSERGVYWDVQAAYDYMDERTDINSKMIIIHGQSIGGAIAIDLAVRKNYRDRVAGLIVENTFTSIAQLLSDYTRVWYLKPFRLLFRCLHVPSKFRSIDKIDQVKCPTFFICCLKDKIVPPDHSKKLHANCTARKGFYIAENGEHLTAYLRDDYVKEMKKFLREFVVMKRNCSICGCGTNRCNCNRDLRGSHCE